ncbi:MAG: hypothetical protein MUP81_00665 [Dehalococcoidia bacterium]|nr:hypothetical protein [Dehalococcoidia bacterium]
MAKTTLPKPTIKGIRDYKEELAGTGGFCANLRTIQNEDLTYYNDTFPTNITKPYHIIRTGSAARLVDSVTWHIDTANPQAFREPRKAKEAEEKRTDKVTLLLNHWLRLLVPEIEEATKNATLLGDAFFQIDYNLDYDPTDSDSLPIIITAPNSMIVYPDPHEYRGVPRSVVKYCRMTVGQVEQMHPEWSNPKKRKPNDRDGVEYLAWWNKDWRYIEADKEAILKGEIQPNVFGFVPIVHSYSGFGKKSPEGQPESIVVGLLRNLRGRIKEECELESGLDSIIGLLANPILVGKSTVEGVVEPEDWDKIDLSPGHTLFLDYGINYEIKSMDANAIQPLLLHLSSVRQALGIELPPIALGLPSTSRATGRQEDIYGEHYRRRFAKLITNIERALATTLSMGLRILDTIPGALPITVRATVLEDGKQINKEETIDKKDIDGYYDCTVKLKSESELADNRKFMTYKMLSDVGKLSWETLLIEGLGWTQDRARAEIINSLVETAWQKNPMLLDVVLREAMEEAGKGRLLRQLDEQTATQSAMGMGVPPAEGQARPSEARNPLASDILRQVLRETPTGTRQSGAGYMQGQPPGVQP